MPLLVPSACATAPVTSALVAKASALWRDRVPVALVPGLAVKPAQLGEHQGRRSPRPVWLPQQSVEWVAVQVFTVWGCSPKIWSGSDIFVFRFLHRIVGGVFNYGASAFMPVPGYGVGRHGQSQGTGSIRTRH